MKVGSEAEAESLLKDYRKWLLKIANLMLPYSTEADRQDLAQEGHIAMWRALKTYDGGKGALPSWLTKAAKMRMADVVRRGILTGMPEQRGTKRVTPQPFDPTEETNWLSVLAYGNSWVDSVEWGYHEGEIAKAIDTLTTQQREYVIRRFWGQQTYTELSKHFGFSATGIWQHTKPKLAQALVHLASV